MYLVQLKVVTHKSYINTYIAFSTLCIYLHQLCLAAQVPLSLNFSKQVLAAANPWSLPKLEFYDF